MTEIVDGEFDDDPESRFEEIESRLDQLSASNASTAASAVSGGYCVGAALATVLSWDTNHALGWAAIGSVVGSALAWAVYLWLKRPRPVPPPPPPRVPWEVALERLYEVRHAGLLETSRFSEFFDRVNDAVREYLGARYGFDGLESTTDETLTALTRLPHFSLPMPELAGFLQQCDLVKFADVTPTLEECQHALSEAERVVRVTMPLVRDDVGAADAQVRS